MRDGAPASLGNGNRPGTAQRPIFLLGLCVSTPAANVFCLFRRETARPFQRLRCQFPVTVRRFPCSDALDLYTHPSCLAKPGQRREERRADSASSASGSECFGVSSCIVASRPTTALGRKQSFRSTESARALVVQKNSTRGANRPYPAAKLSKRGKALRCPYVWRE